MPLTSEPDYMWSLSWAITFAFVVIGIPLVAWILRRQSRARGAVRAYLIGLEGVDAGPRGIRRAPEPKGHFATDTRQAYDFVTAFRVPNSRMRLSDGQHWAELTSRGTQIFTMLVATDERTGRKVSRLARRSAHGGSEAASARVNPEVAHRESASRLLESWRISRKPITLTIGASEVTLTAAGAEVAAALLAGSHRTVDRIAEVLGSEPAMGWADWLPSDRVEYDVTHDSYLDDDGSGWPDAQRPALGGKQRRYRE